MTDRMVAACLMLGALAVATATARPHAGSWNDSSRLAAAECLVDHGTLRIDESIFVDVSRTAHPPFPSTDRVSRHFGTQDKLFINGHFYSDKSPVPSLLLAAEYWLLQQFTGLTASRSPEAYCFVMSVVFAGLAYSAAVGCTYGLGRTVGLPIGTAAVLAVGFGFGTLALPYAATVTSLPLMLAAATGLFWVLLARPPWTILAGSLAGLAYTCDTGSGPILLVAVAATTGRRLPLFLLAAAPWVVLHHGLNYSIGGTFGPANANPEYFRWPHCPFTPQSLTGRWAHPHWTNFVGYVGDLLAGKRGILAHSLPLLVGACALPLLARAVGAQTKAVVRWPGGGTTCPLVLAEWPLLLAGLVWFVGTWVGYAATSNNFSGVNCGVRWFMPLTAVGVLFSAIALRERPALAADLRLLTGFGLMLGAVMAWRGPWLPVRPNVVWAVYGSALAVWAGLALWRRGRYDGTVTDVTAVCFNLSRRPTNHRTSTIANSSPEPGHAAEASHRSFW